MVGAFLSTIVDSSSPVEHRATFIILNIRMKSGLRQGSDAASMPRHSSNMFQTLKSSRQKGSELVMKWTWVVVLTMLAAQAMNYIRGHVSTSFTYCYLDSGLRTPRLNMIASKTFCLILMFVLWMIGIGSTANRTSVQMLTIELLFGVRFLEAVIKPQCLTYNSPIFSYDLNDTHWYLCPKSQAMSQRALTGEQLKIKTRVQATAKQMRKPRYLSLA
jgi:hypothetical protein